MSNTPKSIFLNLGMSKEENEEVVDFNDLIGVTWSVSRQSESDIEYILK